LTFDSPNLKTFKLSSPEIKELIKDADIIINATPLGLKGEEVPIDIEMAKRGAFIMDLIYNPPKTPFLKKAKELKLSCANGLLMLLYQALEAFYIWTGKKPSPEPIKKALLNLF